MPAVQTVLRRKCRARPSHRPKLNDIARPPAELGSETTSLNISAIWCCVVIRSCLLRSARLDVKPPSCEQLVRGGKSAGRPRRHRRFRDNDQTNSLQASFGLTAFLIDHRRETTLSSFARICWAACFNSGLSIACIDATGSMAATSVYPSPASRSTTLQRSIVPTLFSSMRAS